MNTRCASDGQSTSISSQARFVVFFDDIYIFYSVIYGAEKRKFAWSRCDSIFHASCVYILDDNLEKIVRPGAVPVLQATAVWRELNNIKQRSFLNGCKKLFALDEADHECMGALRRQRERPYSFEQVNTGCKVVALSARHWIIFSEPTRVKTWPVDNDRKLSILQVQYFYYEWDYRYISSLWKCLDYSKNLRVKKCGAIFLSLTM